MSEDPTHPRLDHPFDLAHAPPQLEESECPALQSDLLEAAITSSDFNPLATSAEDFFNQQCTSRPLAYFRNIYETDNRQSAIDLLTKRNKINWVNSNYHISNKDTRLVWSNPNHYVDLLVCVARDIGLGILLPNERDHTFTFEFDFTSPYRQFSAKFAKLGFDAKSSFLWVGRSTSHDDVFIAWAPINSLTTGVGEQVEVGLSTGKTTLSQRHYRITVMFFAFVLNELGERGIWLVEPYPNIEEDNEDVIMNASNIL